MLHIINEQRGGSRYNAHLCHSVIITYLVFQNLRAINYSVVRSLRTPENPLISCWVMLFTNKQTNKQTKKQTALKTVSPPPAKSADAIKSVNGEDVCRLTLFPSRSKCVKLNVMRYCAGATICQTQFLFDGYSSGNDGLWMVPLAASMCPPHASVVHSDYYCT